MRTDWITYAQAAKLCGCSRHMIERYVAAGRIRRRYPLGRKSPTIDRGSAEDFAKWWRSRLIGQEQRRHARANRSPRPPSDDDVWLDVAAAALVIGVSAQYLRRLASQERMPAVRRGRLWFRRRDVEQYAAVRAFTRSADRAPPTALAM